MTPCEMDTVDSLTPLAVSFSAATVVGGKKGTERTKEAFHLTANAFDSLQK